jgi:drug/metabolite transporter (DMT)-like permease
VVDTCSRGTVAQPSRSLTFALLYWLYRRVPVTQTQLIPLFSTLLAVLLGAAVLDEGLSWRTAAGGLAILSGLVIAARAGRRLRPSGT